MDGVYKVREIIQGIKDYIKDVFHDWIYRNDYEWKEGNVRHYVQQRKISKGMKK